jgi:hypothetical protein
VLVTSFMPIHAYKQNQSLYRPRGFREISIRSAREGGKVVPPTHRPPLLPMKIISMKNSNDTIGNRTRDLPACSAVPQPTAPPRSAICVYSSHILSPDRAVRKEEPKPSFDVVSTQEYMNESVLAKLWFIRLCSYVFPLTWYLKVGTVLFQSLCIDNFIYKVKSGSCLYA